jgi:type IV pilus assembly protein PilQ
MNQLPWMRFIRYYLIFDILKKRNINRLLLCIICILSIHVINGQDVVSNELRYKQIESNLLSLANQNPGLNETVDFSVSGASIHEFLRGLAAANNLNISVDPSLDFKIYNNFTNEKVSNILLFLVKEFNLDIRFIGTIMAFHPYSPPPAPRPEIKRKEIIVKYHSYNNSLTLDLSRDTLSEVVKKITLETKKNVILSSGLADKTISIYIQEASFDNAIEKMAYANNLKVVKTEDNFYVITTQGVEDDEMLAKESKLPKSSYNNPFPVLDDKRKQTKSSNSSNIGNIYIDVNANSGGEPLITMEAINMPIGETIKSVAASVGISYFLFSDIKGNSSLRLLNVGFDEFLKRHLQGTDYTFKKSNNLYLIGERKLEGLRANKVVQLQYRSAKDIVNMIPADIKHGVEVKEFIELNSLLLTGAQPQIDEIISFINNIDKVVPMVLIDVIIMDIRKNRSIETGIKAGLSDSLNTGGSVFPGLDFVFSSKSINQFLSWLGSNNAVNLGKVKPNFYVGLKALESNNNVDVRATPKLSTLNGHKATLSIGSTRYYSTETQNVVGSLSPQTVVTQQFHQVEANLAISINPVVSGDDQVTLEIEVNNSDFLEAPENRPPASATSQFNSIVRVKNEEMIVLGGLEREEKSETGSGFPLLSRIPIIKWLFSSRTKLKSKTVTIVFIKPSILY